MSLATDLEIHKQGTALLDLCADVQARIPRAFRASMGYRISDECVEILVLIGRANAARQPQDRATHLEQLLERLQVAQILLRTAHAKRLIATKLWATSIELTDTIGKMANGWPSFARAAPTEYTAPVTSKKGVIGIGVPQQPCSESRRTPAVSAAFSLVPPFMAARMGSRKARRFPQGLPGTPTCSSCRPQLALGSAVVANRSPWRPIMAFASARPCATIIPLPTAAATPVIQLRRHGRLPKAVSSLRAARTRATASYTARETRPTYADAHIVTQALAYIESCFHRPEFTITSPRDVADYLRARIGARDHEVFAVLFLDAQHRVLACEEMFRGQSTQTTVYPREVARRALQLNACAIIASHNHPSGNLTPSAADHDLTLTLRRTLELIDVRVLDHIIVSAEGAHSMEAGRHV